MTERIESPLRTGDLGALELFSFLQKKHLAVIVKHAVPRRCSDGEVIYRAHQTNTSLIGITAGSLEKIVALDNEPLVFGVLSRGACWGYENCVSPGARYPYTIRVAPGGATIISVSTYALFQLMQQMPTLRNDLAAAIIRLLIREREQEEKKTLMLSGINAVLNGKKDIVNKLDSALQLVMQHCHAARALLARFDGLTQQLIIERSVNFMPMLTGNSYRLSADTLLSVVYTTQKPLLLNTQNFERKFTLAEYFRPSLFAVPIHHQGHIWGALVITDLERAGEPAPGDTLLLHVIGSLIAGTLTASHDHTSRKYLEYMKRSYIG